MSQAGGNVINYREHFDIQQVKKYPYAIQGSNICWMTIEPLTGWLYRCWANVGPSQIAVWDNRIMVRGVSKTCMSSEISELLNFHLWIKSTSFNVRVRYFVRNFKWTLWNSTQNILPIHWKVWILYYIEILWALRLKSSCAFSKRPPVTKVGLSFLPGFPIIW